MAQDDAAIQRAVTLLSSSDVNENKNGAALVINTAANAHSVPKLLRANVVNLLLPKLNSNDEDLVMKAAWAVNNLSVHDEGRNACFAAGVLQYFGKVLQNKSSEVIKKATWALTNLARNPEAQKEIIRGNVFVALVNVLTYGKDDEEKGFALQPLCNLVLDANNQLAFKNAGGLSPVVRLLSSNVAKTQELAITLISFVTTNHDSIRDELVEQGVLHPLCDLLSGSKTGKLQEYAINSLVNLSLSENAERAILHQGAVKTVVGLLSSEDTKLQQQSAMLLSNLLTNKEIRESVRYLNWVEPALKLVKTSEPAILQQVLRVIINITFDEHCRYQLQKADAASIIQNTTSQSSDNNVFSLSSTAIKNLSVPVPASVQGEVNNRLATGGLEKVQVAKAAQQTKSDFDLSDLDSALGSYGTSAKKPAPAATQPKPQQKPPADDLDDLLGEFNAPAKKPAAQAPPAAKPAPSKPSNNYGLDDLDDLLNDVAPKPASKPAPAKPAPKPRNDLDDIDDLLNDVSKPKAPAKPAPKPKNDLDDIDDLLAGISTGPKKPAPAKPQPAHDDIDDLLSSFEPPRSSAKPPPAKSAPKNDLDDIDDLLAGMNPSRPAARGPSTASRSQPSDDIDDLLNGLGGGGGYRASSYGGDDIDDLLSDLSAPPKHNNRPQNRNTTSGLDAIDDLLADLG